jgi:hypothetical protein
VIDNRGRTLTPCRRKVAEREVRLDRAKWIGPTRIRLRFDPFAYRYIRLKVLDRDNYVCYWCAEPGDTMDHVIPWSKGGRTTLENCICACQECNGQRGDMPAERFARMRNVPPPRIPAKPLGAPVLGVPILKAVNAPVLQIASAAARKAVPAPVVRPASAPVLKAVPAPLAKPVSAPAIRAAKAPAPKTRPAPRPLVAVARPYALMDLLDPYAPAVSRRRLS